MRMVGDDRIELSPRPLCKTFFSRKGAKKTLRNAVALCAFASLRESSSLKVALMHGGTERTRTVIGLVDNQVPHLSATVP